MWRRCMCWPCGVFHKLATSHLPLRRTGHAALTHSTPTLVFFQNNQRARKGALRLVALLSRLGEGGKGKESHKEATLGRHGDRVKVDSPRPLTIRSHFLETDHKNYCHRGIVHISRAHIVNPYIHCPYRRLVISGDSRPVHQNPVSQQLPFMHVHVRYSPLECSSDLTHHIYGDSESRTKHWDL